LRAKSQPAHARTASEVLHDKPDSDANPESPTASPQSPTPERRIRASRANATLSTEDPAEYQRHCRQFFDEYQPATPTESQLTQEIADTAWRLNRLPPLEAALLGRAADPPSEQARMAFDIVDAHRALATLGMHSHRLSRQFQKALDQLREIQSERRQQQERDLKQAAALLELYKHKGIPYHPAELFPAGGFVFSKDQIEAFAERLKRINESRHIEHALFHMQPPARAESRTH
jgi:hypothetical protein